MKVPETYLPSWPLPSDEVNAVRKEDERGGAGNGRPRTFLDIVYRYGCAAARIRHQWLAASTSEPTDMMIRTRRSLLLAGLCVFIAAGSPAFAQIEHADHGAFGSVHFEVSCSPAAQQEFDRAVAMLHSFFYPETDKAFRAIAEREPSCAMAYWGIAISQRPNPLTAPFSPDQLRQGWENVQKARASGSATQRERDWVDALAAFFRNYATVNQQTRSIAYEAEMARLHARYPKDSEAAVFYALSLLEAVDLGDKTYARQLKAADILSRVERTQPEHPGVIHYLIHSYDYAPIAAKGLPSARRYAALAPSAPHALHMPSHIFSTLGMWQDAVRSNLVADASNREYAASTSPAAAANPSSILARYHNLDFLTNAYLQLGKDQAAKAILDERNTIAALPAGERITVHTAYAAIPVRYAFERGAWQDAARLVPMKTPYKQAEAIIWFGRAIGAARSGDVGDAKEDLTQISRLVQELTSAGDPYWAEQVGVQEAAASAWIALAEKNVPRAVALMQEAADREDRTEKHVAMENRLSPMRELLGELLLEAGKPREALQEFERSLRTMPNRFRSLAGAGQSAALTGNGRLARSYYDRLLSLAAGADSERPAIGAARAFLAKGAR
jgi:hypothetical protein